jgi:outer membrane biosynthesis protein TonB
MSDYAHREKKNRIIGISVSVGLHILLLLLFLWVTAWKEPYPPLPEYGIELNMSIDNQGSGNEPVSAQETEEIEETPTEESEETVEDQVEETTDAEAEDVVEEVSEPAEEVVEEAVTDEEAPVKVEDTPTEKAKETPKKEEKEEKKEEPKANPNALFPGDSKSQGETNDKEGDQGNPEGEVDAEAMMGPQGGGSGSQLDMSGWKWDSPPRPNDTSQQNGKIVFEIRVDSNGEVISVRAIETTVSAEVVKIYQDEVAKLSFSRTSGGKTAPQSKGTITFLIRSN